MEIKTKIGTIIIQETIDENNPGVWIDFLANGQTNSRQIAVVEATNNNSLRTIIWNQQGKTIPDDSDPTDVFTQVKRTWNGKLVMTSDDFCYENAIPGDLVSEDVVDNALNCMPPASDTSNCTQMGEPYSHRNDPETGKVRPTFATFRRIASAPENIWEYCGHCFQGKTTESGKES